MFGPGRLPPLMPSAAHAELLRQTGELDAILDGRGLVFDEQPSPPVPPAEPFYIPPADWDEEERERQARERQARERETDAEIAARLENEPDHVYGIDEEQLEETPAEHPPPRRRPWHRSSE